MFAILGVRTEKSNAEQCRDVNERNHPWIQTQKQKCIFEKKNHLRTSLKAFHKAKFDYLLKALELAALSWLKPEQLLEILN